MKSLNTALEALKTFTKYIIPERVIDVDLDLYPQMPEIYG